MAKHSQLTTCRTCDGQVAIDAPTCPHCGAPNPALRKSAATAKGTAHTVKIDEPVQVEKKNSYESIKSDGCLGCGCLFALIFAALYLALWSLGIVDPENS